MFDSKRGIGVGQAFIYILVAITFVMIMIFGFRAILGFIDTGEDVQFAQFKTDLESSIQSIYSQFGSVHTEKFHLPASYKLVCFVDLNKPYPADDNCNFDAYGCDVWKDASARADAEDGTETGYDFAEENVFLRPYRERTVKIKVYPIAIDSSGDDFLCLDIKSGSFSLRLKGLGSKTELSETR